MSDFSDINLLSRLVCLKGHLYQWIDENDDLVVELEELADNLDEHFNKISKAKVGGATGAIVGSILGVIGFGLSFVTFGASLGLTIAGGVIAGSGGIVVSGSQITDAVLSKKRISFANNILKKYISRVEILTNECVGIGTLLKDSGDIKKEFPLWFIFWAKIAFNSGTCLKNICWDVVGRTLLNSLRLASFADDAVSTGATVANTAFKTMGATGRALHVAGGVSGVLFLPFDIHTLVTASIDVHKTNPHKSSEKIREMAANIKAGRPTKEDIGRMVVETVARIAK